MKKLFKKEFMIGLWVLIAMVVLIFGINFLKGINVLKAANYYYASYTNVTGLAVSAPVTLNGYKVGLVRSIEYEYDNPGHVLVEMSLDKDVKVPQGSKAVLASDILGTASIQLHLSSNSAHHEIGDKLIGVNKPGLLDALSDDLMPAISSIFPKIDTLLTNVNALVENPSLTAAVTRLDAITADLQATTKNLAAVTGKLSPVMTDVKSITANVTDLTADLSDLSGRLKAMPIEDLIANLEATTANLKQLSEQLGDPTSTLGMLMRDPALYNNLNTTVSSLDSLLIDIKKNPKRYISIKVF